MKKTDMGYGLVGILKKHYGHKPNLFDEHIIYANEKTYRMLFDYGCPQNYLIYVFCGKEKIVTVFRIVSKTDAYWCSELIKIALKQNLSFAGFPGGSITNFINFLDSTEEGQKVFKTFADEENRVSGMSRSYASVMY